MEKYPNEGQDKELDQSELQYMTNFHKDAEKTNFFFSSL